MDSKFLIPGDSIAWTFAKPAMLAVAVVGGISGNPGHAGKSQAPNVSPDLHFAPTMPVPGPGFTTLGAEPLVDLTAEALARPSGIAIHAARRPGRTAHLTVPAARPAPAAEEPARFAEAFPVDAPADLTAASGLPAMVADAADALLASQKADLAVRAPAASPVAPMSEISRDVLFQPEPASGLAVVTPAPVRANAIAFTADPVVQPLAPAAAVPVVAAPPVTLASPAAPAKPDTALSRVSRASVKGIAAAEGKAPPRAAFAAASLAEQNAVAVRLLHRAEPKKPVTGLVAPAPAKRISGGAAGKTAYAVGPTGIDFALVASVNGIESGSLPLRVGTDDRLWVRLGDLLRLVQPRMDAAEYGRFAAAAKAAEYVEFDTVRAAGIDLRYDAARNRVALSVD